MEWYVYIENINRKCIEKYNIFEHYSFLEDIKKAYKEADGNFQLFENKVKSSLTYYFWSKCEWEIILSDWPPSPEKFGFKKEKVDVYSQVMLNWNIFINYVWDNIKENNK